MRRPSPESRPIPERGAPTPRPRGDGVAIGAAVDVGSNSVHLLVAVVRGHRLQPLVDESVFLGLGAAADAHGAFGPELQAELIATLGRYAGTARELGARAIAFVGTDPLRRASDGIAVAEAVHSATGVAVEILDHREEALLTLLGVTAGRSILRETLVVDIGGGSSEFLDVAPGRDPIAVGLPLGSARLTRTIVASDPPTPGELESLLAEARRIVATAPAATPDDIVLVGGTASNLLRVLPESALDRTLTRRRLAQALAIVASETVAVASSRHGIRPERARILPAGAAIVAAIMERYEADRVRVSEAGIREGTVLAAIHGGPRWRSRLAWLAHGWTR